ncbi:MAG: hypothetical protein WBI07_21665 [Mobilitalea sp.]
MGRKDKKVDFNKIVLNKKLPILTLDIRWHSLFPEGRKSPEILDLEQSVNGLLKKQGKLVNDIKDMKKLKTSLLKEIVVNMDIRHDIFGKAKEKKIDRNKQFIEELNDKIEAAMDELADIPYQIKSENEALMVASLAICYDQLEDNKNDLDEITDRINEIKDELKMLTLKRQNMEEKNNTIYHYMHDLLGRELMELFDRENDSK